MPSSWTSWEEFGFKMQREDFKELKTYGEFCQFIAGKVA